ncbi:MAG TPA: hypothetical protein ENI60_02590 [Candidatus Fraserbacteria bacterium]|nr:hypothetical protein [Candidatus Fraserbacteria bacterium]
MLRAGRQTLFAWTDVITHANQGYRTLSISTEHTQLISRFVQELSLAGGQTRQVHDLAQLVSAIADILRERQTGRLLVAADNLITELDLVTRLRAKGIEVITSDEPAQVAQLEVGLTGALAAVASSGTLLLAGGASLASLLPPLHLALIRAEQIEPDLTGVWPLLGQAIRTGERELCLITGPSKTADIEQTLVQGVHGPGELIVIILSEDEPGGQP